MNKQQMTKIKHETVTCGIFYCRYSAKMKGCGLLQTLSRFDRVVLRNRQLTIPPTVTSKHKEKNIAIIKIEK
jgi:hypothetical protein